MTPEQRSLCRDLVIFPNRREPRISQDQFAVLFPSSLEAGRLSTTLLADICQRKDGEDLEGALTVGSRFGFSPTQTKFFIELLEADWHTSHEDIVSALDKLNDPNALEALIKATQSIPKHLEWDENRAMAVKAIYAIGKIRTPDADRYLSSLENSENPILSKASKKQFEDRK